MFRDQNAGRIDKIKFDNSPFEKVEEFKYWGKTLKNPNCIKEKLRTNSNQGILAIILGRIYYFPVSYSKI
jgi:hypothetical protein